jgi:putative redox protein
MARTMEIEVVQRGPATSEARIRGHRVSIDRPLEKGGEDQGPMGGELFLASIGGCFMSTLLAAIRAREADVAGLSIEVRGTLEDDGGPTRYTAIELVVSGRSADPTLLRKLVTIAERSCIMWVTLAPLFPMAVRPRDGE